MPLIKTIAGWDVDRRTMAIKVLSGRKYQQTNEKRNSFFLISSFRKVCRLLVLSPVSLKYCSKNTIPESFHSTYLILRTQFPPDPRTLTYPSFSDPRSLTLTLTHPSPSDPRSLTLTQYSVPNNNQAALQIFLFP